MNKISLSITGSKIGNLSGKIQEGLIAPQDDVKPPEHN